MTSSPSLRPHLPSHLLLALVLLAGCGDGPRDEGPATAGATGGSATGGQTSATGMGSAGDASDGGSATTDGPKFDVGDGATGGGDGGADTCTNVDVLFVIDDSGSMADQQASLAASVPGFIAGIEQKLADADSLHVGVVTSDAYTYNEAGCRQLGDLVTQTGGQNSSNQVCTPFASGGRYLDETEPDFDSKFACIAKVGTLGDDDEKMMGAMLGALEPARNDPGGCNEGFHRLDSLLVVVLVTDEDDAPEPYGCDPNDVFGTNGCDTVGSGGTPDDWYAQLLAYKANLPENIVVLSFVGRGPNPSCGAQVNSKIAAFTDKFGDHGYVGDVCASDYSVLFDEALPVVEKGCQDYVPPEG